jgi:predicted cupin superfamily sugar epimerase
MAGGSARDVIERLALEPLPGEGGYFRRVWTSGGEEGTRPAATAIYFLITVRDYSALHCLDAPEMWHFYAGDSVEHVCISDAGVRVTVLGADVCGGDTPTVVVPPRVWQGARLATGGRHGWALVGCTMTPGWRHDGFVLASRTELLSSFPQHAEWVLALTRPQE